MPGILSKQEIVQQLNEAAKDFSAFSNNVNDEVFFYKPVDKWSVAQNVLHVKIAAKSTLPAYKLPKFIIRLYTGKPNRASRTYDELVAKYRLKLQNGGRAMGHFIPKEISRQENKEKIIQSFSVAMEKLITALDKKWDDVQLDHYIALHPLLGKITLRELGYFTIYHTYHHLDIIKERVIQ